MAIKYATIGSALMAIFIFIITGLFSWFGNATLNNHDANTKFVISIQQLNKSINKLNDNIKDISQNITENKINIVKNSLKIDRLSRVLERKGL